MSNFEKVSAATGPRTELHNKLHLTGAEISVNNLQKFHLFTIIKRTKKFTSFQQVLEKQ